METLHLPLTLHEGFPEDYSEIEDQKCLVTEQKAHSYLCIEMTEFLVLTTANDTFIPKIYCSLTVFSPSLVADFSTPNFPYTLVTNCDMQAYGKLDYKLKDIRFCQATSTQRPIKTLH